MVTALLVHLMECSVALRPVVVLVRALSTEHRELCSVEIDKPTRLMIVMVLMRSIA